MILVTGATGTTGREVVRRLAAKRASVRALARWHAETEAQLERSGLGYTNLRPGFFMQNFLMFAAGHTAAVDPTVRDVTRAEPRSFRQFAADHAALFRDGTT